jgi:hypothetical protein
MAAITLAAVAAATGCGNDDEAEIRSVVATVQDDFAAGRLDAVCDSMTDAEREHIHALGHETPASRGRTCGQQLKAFLVDGIRTQARRTGAGPPEITSLEIDGDTALVTVEGPDGHSQAVPMARQDGEWKVNGLFGGIPAERQSDKF